MTHIGVLVDEDGPCVGRVGRVQDCFIIGVSYLREAFKIEKKSEIFHNRNER